MQQLTVLVKSSNTRYVAVCQNGMLALVWQRAIIHLRADELARIVHTLEHWAYTLDAAWVSDDLITVTRDAAGAVQLWVGGVGLHLAAHDLLALADLLTIAALRLHAATTLTSTAAQSCITAFCPLRLPPDGGGWQN